MPVELREARSGTTIREFTILRAPEGSVELLPFGSGHFTVTLKPNAGVVVPRGTCHTSLPVEVISAFVRNSFVWACESLARHEDPEYLKKILQRHIHAYVDPSNLRGKRLLDFGCGSGASTIALAQMLPETEIVGVELNATNIDLARRVLAARRLPNVRFLVSPDPNRLPDGIGTFDFVMLSAVYEHLLPKERCKVMPLIWSCMNDGGLLFVNQTPYRYFPYEHHSTGLWFINYLPDSASLYLARNFSRIKAVGSNSPDWNVHLRGGIRGGTEAEILRNLRLSPVGRPVVIKPRSMDRAQYWLSGTSEKYRAVKRGVAALFRLTDQLLGTVPSLNLEVVIRKDAR